MWLSVLILGYAETSRSYTNLSTSHHRNKIVFSIEGYNSVFETRLTLPGTKKVTLWWHNIQNSIYSIYNSSERLRYNRIYTTIGWVHSIPLDANINSSLSKVSDTDSDKEKSVQGSKKLRWLDWSWFGIKKIKQMLIMEGIHAR